MTTHILAAILSALSLSQGASPPDWYIRRKGPALIKHGQPWRLVGGNNYRAAGGPPATACQMAQDPASHAARLEVLFAQMQKDGLNTLRLWAFQSYAGPSGRDYSAFDRVVSAAKRHHIRLIMTLENHWGDCTEGGVKSPAWYASGYATRYGNYALSLPDYVQGLVRHYKDEATIAAWQLVNESECIDGQALFQFASRMSALVRGVDGTHLISMGTLACRQYGTDVANMTKIHALPAIDLVEAHDYNNEATAMPDCIAANIGVAHVVGKPFMLGEVGLNQGDDKARAAHLSAKMAAHVAAGTQAFFVWSIYVEGSNDGYAVPIGSAVHRALLRGARQFDPPAHSEL